MGTPQPLPLEMRNRVFSRAEVIARGLADSRLRAADVEKVGRGLYRVRSAFGSSTSEADLYASGAWEGIQATAPQCWFSYQTACAVYGLASRRPMAHSPVHVGLPHQSRSMKQLPWIRVHRPEKVFAGEIRRVGGVRVSSPERLFLEMAGVLDLWDVVVLGDQLVRVPRRQYEERSEPWTTPQQLWKCLSRHPSTVGIVNARAAAELVRVGSDSPPETLLRLSILEAGLSEPELQCRLDPTDPRSPRADMAYRDKKLALQYEGEHHFTAEQQAVDQGRNWQFAARGWSVMLANRVDLQERFSGVVRRVATVLAH